VLPITKTGGIIMNTLTTVKISTGNSKLQNTFIFSMPPVATCPGATDACKQDCYAIKAYKQYPNVRTAWNHNQGLSEQDNFVEIVADYLATELGSKRKTSKFRHFRIHESGDFYNQKYLDKWISIAKQFPAIEFLAYTKSGWLDFSDCPANMVVRMSIWEDSNPRKVNDELPRATMEGMEQRKGAFHCKPTYKCAECRFCWASTKDVFFTKH
jgi:hypothetical protein